MSWTPEDWINLVEKLIWPTIIGVSILFFLCLFRREIKKFISKVNKVGGELSKDSVKFDASCEDNQNPDALALDHPKQTEASPQIDEEDNQVDAEDELTLLDIFHQIKKEGIEPAKRTFEEFIKPFETDEPNITLRAFFIFRLFSIGNYQEAFNDFKKLYESHTNDDSRSTISQLWAKCYAKSKQHDKAQEILNKALLDIASEPAKTKIICQLALSYSSSDHNDKAISILTERIGFRHNTEEKASLYGTLSKVERDLGNEVIAALCLEKKAEYLPTDSNVLFDAAYNLSQAEVQSLSLFHYVNLLDLSPDHEAALNNIGVTASELELEVKSIEFQTKAFNHNNSLACANIGTAFLNAGFVEEARQMAQQGIKMDSPHENNYELMSKINNVCDEENKKWQDFVNNSGTQREHLSNYLDAHYFNPEESSCPFTGVWIDHNGISFTVSEEDNTISAEWNRSTSRKLGILEMKTEKVTNYRLSGSFSNYTARINITTTETPTGLLHIAPPSYFKLFSYIDNKNGNWIIFSTDLKKPYEKVFKRPNN